MKLRFIRLRAIEGHRKGAATRAANEDARSKAAAPLVAAATAQAAKKAAEAKEAAETQAALAAAAAKAKAAEEAAVRARVPLEACRIANLVHMLCRRPPGLAARVFA